MNLQEIKAKGQSRLAERNKERTAKDAKFVRDFRFQGLIVDKLTDYFANCLENEFCISNEKPKDSGHYTKAVDLHFRLDKNRVNILNESCRNGSYAPLDADRVFKLATENVDIDGLKVGRMRYNYSDHSIKIWVDYND